MEPGQALGAHVGYLGCHFTRSNGEAMQFQAKFSHWPGQCTLWDLRNFLNAWTYRGSGRHDFCITIRRQLPLWEHMWQRAGLDPHACFKKSLKAGGDAGDPKVTDQFQVSTEALLHLFLFWQSYRKDKQEAIDQFKAFLFGACGPEIMTACPDDLHAADYNCQEELEDNACIHVRHWRADRQGGWDGPPQFQAAEMLLHLSTASLPCHSLQAFLNRAVKALATALVEHAVAKCCTDPLKAEHLEGNLKRRRYDSDYQAAICRQVLQKRLSPTSGAYARANPEGASASSTSTWSEKDLAEYVSAGWLTFGSSQTMSVAADAKRMGSPPEDMVHYACWALPADQAMWLPCQAIAS
jgi:hypothetical protein